MYGYIMEFSSLPKNGFALHCKIPQYRQKFTPEQEGIEIVYIKSGTIVMEYLENKWIAPPGSILVLKRDLPFCLYTQNNETNEHSSVQIIADFDIKVVKDIEKERRGDLFSLPFLLMPHSENEKIIKKLNSVIKEAADTVSSNDITRGLLLSSILYDVSRIWKMQGQEKEKAPSILCYKIKKIIAENWDEEITLNFLAEKLGKTPNYLNYVFKEETKMTIHSYIINEKIKTICNLILSRSLSFKDACSSVGISDVSYGYRLFKKQTGLTPGDFIKGETYDKYRKRM